MDTKKVDVQTASRILGISSDAVRKRIERKSLKGIKENGVWMVIVEDTEPDKRPESVQKRPESVQKRPESVQTTDQNRPDTQALIDAYKSRDELYQQTISIMQDTITTLTRELESKQLELEWKDILFLKAMNEKSNELRKIKQLLEPKPSFFRRLLSGRTDK